MLSESSSARQLPLSRVTWIKPFDPDEAESLGAILPSFLRVETDSGAVYIGVLLDCSIARETCAWLIENLRRAVGGTLEVPPLTNSDISELATNEGTERFRGLFPLIASDFFSPQLWPLTGRNSRRTDGSFCLSVHELAARAYRGIPDPLWLRTALHELGFTTARCIEAVESVFDIARRADAIERACDMEVAA